MTNGTQGSDSDPIFDALGIRSDDPDPEVPPLDTVYGFYQDQGPERFRLLLKSGRCYMSHFKNRILSKEPLSGGGTKLVLRADGNYRGELVIHCHGGGLDPEATKGTVAFLYAYASVPETTPWHPW